MTKIGAAGVNGAAGAAGAGAAWPLVGMRDKGAGPLGAANAGSDEASTVRATSVNLNFMRNYLQALRGRDYPSCQYINTWAPRTGFKLTKQVNSFCGQHPHGQLCPHPASLSTCGIAVKPAWDFHH